MGTYTVDKKYLKKKSKLDYLEQINVGFIFKQK